MKSKVDVSQVNRYAGYQEGFMVVYSTPGSESQVMCCENPVGGGDFITRVKTI
jgi:hypothetical protein